VNLGFRNIEVVRIAINLNTKIERMRYRGDNEEAIMIRVAQDEVDGIWGDPGVPVIELSATQPMEEKVSRILRAC
jgi:hypothetical protein